MVRLEDDYNRRCSIESAMILGWLMNRGCELGDDTQKALPDLRSADPRWRPEWEEAADESYDGGGGIFQTDADPSPVIDPQLSQIIPLAKEHTRSSLDELIACRPFDGLVEQRPRQSCCCFDERSTTRRLSSENFGDRPCRTGRTEHGFV